MIAPNYESMASLHAVAMNALIAMLPCCLMLMPAASGLCDLVPDGTQREYYVMHHLFLTNRGVYVVVTRL